MLIVVVLQLWLLAATMNAYLGNDDSVIVPAAVASLVCFGPNLFLCGDCTVWSGRIRDRTPMVTTKATRNIFDREARSLASAGGERFDPCCLHGRAGQAEA